MKPSTRKPPDLGLTMTLLAAARRAVATAIACSSLFIAACGGGGGGGGSPPPPPSAPLSYASPQHYVVGTAIAPLTPTTTEALSGFFFGAGSTGLPPGLALNSSTGAITGTPTTTNGVYASGESYAILASEPDGKTVSATLEIVVTAVPANAISYGASAFTFTAGVAAQPLTPETGGGTVTGWSISRQLPAGLAFDASNGTITGTPTSAQAATTYTVTAQNSAGPLKVSFTIEVDTTVLVDQGHDAALVLLQFNGSSVLSEDGTGHWVLWNYATAAMIASGTGCMPDGVQGEVCSLPGSGATLNGTSAVIRTQTGFEVLSATTGAVMANIAASGSWWLLATDGSYILVGSTTGLTAWSPTGQMLVTRAGDYSTADRFASPGAIRIAAGPAGSNVLETVSVPGGADTISPAFNGQFVSWFFDGSAFTSSVGSTVLIYSDAAVQEAALAGAGTVWGEGSWMWSFSNSSLNFYALASPTVVAASYPCVGNFNAAGALPFSVSGSTVSILTVNNTLCVVDLSGAVPVEATYTLPIGSANGLQSVTNSAAASTSTWVVGSNFGVVLGAASGSGTSRFFDNGQALSIAGNANQIALATASGSILYFNAVTLAQEGTIQFPSSQIALSPDGSILAALSSPLNAPSPQNQSINIYSLPSASLLYSWSYPANSNTTVQNFYLSGTGTGTVLGQVLAAGAPGGDMVIVSAPTGGAPTLSTTGPDVLQLSPDGTLAATSAGNPAYAGPAFNGFGTNIWESNKLVTAVSGWPAGWIDDSHLLVNLYQADYLQDEFTDYTGCAIYGPTGMSAGTCDLPNVVSFQTVTSDTLYALNLNEIVSVSTGAVSWASGNAVTSVYTPPNSIVLSFLDTLAGNHVIFVSGAQVVVQSY